MFFQENRDDAPHLGKAGSFTQALRLLAAWVEATWVLLGI
jgi:hypothetical protein